MPALRLIHDYSLNRKQRTRINNSHSTWIEILFEVSQGSILDGLLINVFDQLQICFLKFVFTWFDNNHLKGNADKWHLKIGTHEIANTKCDKLLGVHFDIGLSFDYRISEICKKASRKVFALARVTSVMSLSEKVTLRMRFSSHNLTIVYLLGCAIVARITIKSKNFMEGV